MWNVLSRNPVFVDLAEHPAALRLVRSVVGWPALDSYFGGVAAIGPGGPGADPRRGGDVREVVADAAS